MEKIENADIVIDQFALINRLVFSTSFSRKTLGLQWIKGMIQWIKEKNKVESDLEENFVLCAIEKWLMDLISAVEYESEHEIRAQIGDLWTVYLQHFGPSRRGHPNTPKVFLKMLDRRYDVHETVRTAFSNALKFIDPFDCLISVKQLDDITSASEEDKFKRLVMSTGTNDLFAPRHFNAICSYLGMSRFIQGLDDDVIAFTGLDQPLESWLPRIYFSCQAPQAISEVANEKGSYH